MAVSLLTLYVFVCRALLAMNLAQMLLRYTAAVCCRLSNAYAD